MNDGLFDYLPKDEIVAAFERSPGNEFGSGKFTSPESSAALAANTFGFFIERPSDLPIVPGTEDCSWPASYVGIEECARFPWTGGTHPWLDAFVETATHIVGIESKRYEPYRTKQVGEFSEAYWRPVWGDNMGPFERKRDRLAEGSVEFEKLDAVQLVKHAFGLRTEGHRRGKSAMLLYLYAEPESWADGKRVHKRDKKTHRTEIQRFSEEVSGAEVTFKSCSYKGLLNSMMVSSDAEIRDHAELVGRTFSP